MKILNRYLSHFLCCFLGVDSPVANQAGVLGEALSTVGALVGPFARVGPLVNDEVRAPAKALPTVGTSVGFLPSVGPDVIQKV